MAMGKSAARGGLQRDPRSRATIRGVGRTSVGGMSVGQAPILGHPARKGADRSPGGRLSGFEATVWGQGQCAAAMFRRGAGDCGQAEGAAPTGPVRASGIRIVKRAPPSGRLAVTMRPS